MEGEDKTIICLIWFIETVSEVLDVAASSAHEEDLDSVEEGVASAAQEMSDTATRNQDAEESGRASEGAGVQLGLKPFISKITNGCLHWAGWSDALCC